MAPNISKTISFSATETFGKSVDDDDDDGYSDLGSVSTGLTRSSSSRRNDDLLANNYPELAQREQRAVTCSKLIMISVLLLAVSSIATSTFWIITEEEQRDFEVQFENYASEVIAVSTENVINAFGAIEGFGNTITSYAQDTNKVWPNVTIPDYTSRAMRVGNLASSARLVTFSPLVNGGNDRLQFEEYARENVYEQIQQDIDYQGLNATSDNLPGGIPPVITYFNLTERKRLPETSDGPFLVNWQRMPFEVEKGRIFVMNNMLRIPTIASAVKSAQITKLPTIAFFEAILGVESQVIQPIFETVIPPHQLEGMTTMEKEDTRKMVGVLWVVMDWGNYFQNLLRDGANGIILVMKSSCGFETTYQINGLEAEFLGLGDHHDPAYGKYEIAVDFFNFQQQDDQSPTTNDVCVDRLTLHLYPSTLLEDSFKTKRPLYYTITVVSIFAFTAFVFVLYDYFVAARQRKVMERVTTQERIVSNLFPASFRDRLYGLDDSDGLSSIGGGGSSSNGRKGLMLNKKDVNSDHYKTKPIADLFLQTTVLFADISGFTAWSSAREPSQVFTLLENIYGAFDKLAHSHSVFKVETIGDCYVAVAGLPEPRADHAVAMAKFARACMHKMKYLTNKLEVSLGPETGDLELRIGLHSGQVTAGVLRGERSRFQLFGDTVNTASRMESTGVRRRIQISCDTALILQNQGRSKWVHERGEKIPVHGKGQMQTYWLETKIDSKKRERLEQMEMARTTESTPKEDLDESECLSDIMDEDDPEPTKDMTKLERLVEFNVSMLKGLLVQIEAARGHAKSKSLLKVERTLGQGETVLEEFKEIITLPKITINDLQKRRHPEEIVLKDNVVSQLRVLITKIANLYTSTNDFHNFEHASHVTSSVMKLLSRIVTTDTTRQTSGQSVNVDLVDLAGHSYGITSDPLTQFAVAFSAIIHDAEHPGIPNSQLVKEKVPMAAKYKEKSIAEQNSVHVTWNLLMQSEFADLRAAIYSNEDELRRFRQLVVNTVMATDIVDKELGALRKARWAKAFSESTDEDDETSPDLEVNRKATIVIEHLIQASDVAHTMQHWKVYRRWNERFFFELYDAYKAGRAETDPSVGWYKGEIGFFDFYIIPLAKKLDNCGCFGVSSHEYLNYAEANREEWIREGEQLVQQYIANYEAEKSNVLQCQL